MQGALCLRNPAFNWKTRPPDHGGEKDALVVDLMVTLLS